MRVGVGVGVGVGVRLGLELGLGLGATLRRRLVGGPGVTRRARASERRTRPPAAGCTAAKQRMPGSAVVMGSPLRTRLSRAPLRHCALRASSHSGEPQGTSPSGA